MKFYNQLTVLKLAASLRSIDFNLRRVIVLVKNNCTLIIAIGFRLTVKTARDATAIRVAEADFVEPEFLSKFI